MYSMCVLCIVCMYLLLRRRPPTEVPPPPATVKTMTDSDNGDVIISPEPGAVVTTDDPYQDLSEEILGLIGKQGREERVWNEEGRSLGYKKSMERERMINKARFQEHKTNVGIMENGIRYSFIKSSQEMDQMDNGELRNHFVLLETELGDRLESLELELLHFDTAASLLGGDCAVTRQIVKECKIECKAMIRHLENLMEKREVSRTKPTFHRRNLPTFSGIWHGRNVFNFKKKITFNLTKMEVPKTDWTFWTLDRLSGQAIVTIKSIHHDVSKMGWDEIWKCLELFFGEESFLRDRMIRQHQSVGKMSKLYDNTNWRKRARRLQHHLSLINETLELSHLVGNHREEIIDFHYANNLMATLTESDRLAVRERNETWECLSPLERTLAVQRRMKTMLEHALAEQKVSHSANEDLTSGCDSPSDDPDGTDKNPSPSL